jgi:ribosome-binding factor A
VKARGATSHQAPAIRVPIRFARKDADARDIGGHDARFGKPFMSRHHQPAKHPGGSQRQLRVGELVRHAIAEVLTQGGVHDPVLASHVVTIPEVKMSPDLRIATVYVMPLGGRDTKSVIAALAANKTFLRAEVARRVSLKYAPDLRFLADNRFDEAARIDELLRTPAVQRDLKTETESDDE